MVERGPYPYDFDDMFERLDTIQKSYLNGTTWERGGHWKRRKGEGALYTETPSWSIAGFASSAGVSDSDETNAEFTKDVHNYWEAMYTAFQNLLSLLQQTQTVWDSINLLPSQQKEVYETYLLRSEELAKLADMIKRYFNYDITDNLQPEEEEEDEYESEDDPDDE